MSGFEKVEYTKFSSAPDCSKAEHYCMAEIWFTNPDTLEATMDSPEARATADDLENFATGGVTLLVDTVE